MLRNPSSSARRYFFEENGIAVTVNLDRYINIVNNFLESKLRRRSISKHNLWFQQDEATAYTVRASMENI